MRQSQLTLQTSSEQDTVCGDLEDNHIVFVNVFPDHLLHVVDMVAFVAEVAESGMPSINSHGEVKVVLQSSSRLVSVRKSHF